jgi:prepilin-type N-terminal cleavage/methylation domain-containing protein
MTIGFTTSNDQLRRLGPSVRYESGFTLIEMIISMVITLIILGVAVATFSGALTSRIREAGRTDAITSAQAALNIMTREIGNSGYGLTNNGLVVNQASYSTDNCNENQIHFRSNINNSDLLTNGIGEDITFYFDPASRSVVRYDPAASPQTSGIINSVSDVDFYYYNFGVGCPNTPGGCLGDASPDTGKVKITLTVVLDDTSAVNANGNPRNVEISSEVTLRNSPTVRGRY